MYWQPTKQVDNGRFLAVGIKIFPDGQQVYQEFAGVGCTEAEAKTKAVLRMWREARKVRGHEDADDVYVWPSYAAKQLPPAQ
jgi:hypothetical protein